MTKIAIVDDTTILMSLLSPWINGMSDTKVVVEAKDGKDFMSQLQGGSVPDIVLLDVNMPVMDGFETAKKLAESYPAIKVIILTSLSSEIVMIRLLKMGVRGFLSKEDITAKELGEAIVAVKETGYYYPGSKLVHILRNIDSRTPMLNNRSITEVEMQFLKLASTPMTYKEIAIELGVSTRTVDGYRESLFTKLEVSNRVSLALFAVKHGIVRL